MKQPKYGITYTLPLFLWVSLFLVVPIAIVFVYSFLTKDPKGGGVIWQFSVDAFTGLNNALLRPIGTTVIVAVVATLITILIALPCSYYLARTKDNTTLLMLVIIPFWVNFLIRVWAWMAVLGTEGFVNDILLVLGNKEPIQFLHNVGSVVLVHIYTYLPFAILPLYSTIEKFDFGLLEAARDLGADHKGSLVRILLPNIRSGIVTAFLFTFIPTLGSFAISDLVGGKDGEMIGNSIAYAVGKGLNWPRASALSVILILISGAVLLVYALVQRQYAEQARKEASE